MFHDANFFFFFQINDFFCHEKAQLKLKNMYWQPTLSDNNNENKSDNHKSGKKHTFFKKKNSIEKLRKKSHIIETITFFSVKIINRWSFWDQQKSMTHFKSHQISYNFINGKKLFVVFSRIFILCDWLRFVPLKSCFVCNGFVKNDNNPVNWWTLIQSKV